MRLSQITPVSQRYQLVLSAVHMVYRLVNSTYNVNELSLRLTRLLCQFIKAQAATIVILDPDKKKIALAAIFNNKINILLDKKKDLDGISEKEKRVTEGNAIFEKHLMGIPLVGDDSVGAIFVRRGRRDPAFEDFDRQMLSVFAEQAVTAIKNLQLHEQHQTTILSSIKFIDKLLEKQRHSKVRHSPVYFKVVKALAQKLHVREEGIERLYYASVLHDAGAIDIPFEILSKTSQLTSQEFKIIRDLPTRSAALIKPVEFLAPVLPIILYQHENYDGSGYPSGMKNEQIPLGARIMAVMGAFEAMITGRPYRGKVRVQAAVKELKRQSGTQFDPSVVEAFCELYKEKNFRNDLYKLK